MPLFCPFIRGALLLPIACSPREYAPLGRSKSPCCCCAQEHEEVMYDYKFPVEKAKIPCHCGSARCLGVMN